MLVGCAYLGEDELHLTPIEYKLLCLLSKNVGKVLTHTFITQNIWGRSWDNDVASEKLEPTDESTSEQALVIQRAPDFESFVSLNGDRSIQSLICVCCGRCPDIIPGHHPSSSPERMPIIELTH